MHENRPEGCDKCKKECTIHLTQIINGKVKKMDMCEDCPKAKESQDPMQFGLMEQLLSMALGKGFTGMLDTPSARCSACQYTETQFKKTGRLGCPACYDIFVLPRIEILSNIQESTVHKGKIPASYKQPIQQNAHQQKIIELEKELTQLIKSEEYEKAAQIRDEIRSLKQKIEISPKQEKKPRKPRNPTL